jgi:RimJ/RimL family protein N-acetyltransferase
VSGAVLETLRLRLRPATLQDTDAFVRLWGEPAVRRFLFDDRLVSRQEVHDLLERSAACFAREGWGLWRVDRDREEPAAPAGFAGFLRSQEGLPDLVYGMHPAHQGEGLATEAAQAVLQHLFTRCGAPRLTASVDEPNVASVRVLEKLGLRWVRRETGAAGGLLVYELARPPD